MSMCRRLCFMSLIQQIAKSAMQRLNENLLYQPVRLMREVIFATTRCRAQRNPVGCAVAGAAKKCPIHKSLQQPYRMRVHLLPVSANARRYLSQQVRRKMWNPDPRQNQETCV